MNKELINGILRARACTRCKEYVVIHANNPVSKKIVNNFEELHQNHTLITINLNEIKGIYKSYDPFASGLNGDKIKHNDKKKTDNQEPSSSKLRELEDIEV